VVGSARSRARRGSSRSIELLLRAGAEFFELRVEPPDFGIQFDETQAWHRNQILTGYAAVIVTGVCFDADTSRGLLRRWIPLQVQEIET
jgi:hypothetical protein